MGSKRRCTKMGEEGKESKDQIEALRRFPLRMTMVVDLFFIYALHSAAPSHFFSTSAIKAIRDLINAPKYTGLKLFAPAPVDSAEGTSKDVTAASSPAT